MTRITHCVFAMLLVLEATAATAGAQGRGRGSSGGPSRMVRTGAASAPARAASRPAMNPGRMASPLSNRHITARPSRIVTRPRRYVFIDPVYPGLSNGFYDPYWYSPFYSGPYLPSYADPYYAGPPRSESNGDLAYQVQLLIREVERLREQQVSSPPPVSRPPAPQPAPPPPPPRAPEPPPPSIALVFRDGRRLNIQNYASVRQTLFVLGDQGSTKVALSELDLDATQTANPGRVLLFSQPQVNPVRSGF
jgi:hypothetical protein